jgi:hypothetical protein
MDEVWKPVATHPGRYEVSNLGRVRACPQPGWRGCVFHNGRYRILATKVGGRARNYLRVHLYGPERFAFVHALVAEAFIGPRPEGLVVLHENDDGFDNRATKLRYGDRDENELDRHVARVAPELEPAPF